jgi:pimeloyl-ACP methyl ester carboxylesterase
VLDWADDVGEVADKLNFDKFAVMCVSACGAYALACAYKIPKRLTGCGLVSTLSPGSIMIKSAPLWMRFTWRLAINHSRLFKKYLDIAVSDNLREKTASDKYMKQYMFLLSKSDKKILSNADVQESLSLAFSESYRQGAKAGREAALQLPQSWGFDPKDVKCEKVFLWHGEKDKMMPIKPARILAATLPNCEAAFYADEGHFSLIANHSGEIFSKLRG